jgi:hypothetical protein
MKTILINNDIEIAKYAFESGVDRIMVDTECLNKTKRQTNVDAVFNTHEIKDAERLKKNIKGEIICRINCINSYTNIEVEKTIDSGADYLMVPMIRDELDVKTILKLTKDKIKFIPLLETSSSLIRLKEIVEIDGISELYFGLNDLSIDMKLKFLHEITASKLMRFCSNIIDSKFKWGFGGIARINNGSVPAETILSEHFLCGSTRIILGRAFHDNSITIEDYKKCNLKNELDKLNKFWNNLTKEKAELLNKQLSEKITNFRNQIVFKDFKKSI